jgi:prepilin-type N-terminal cleavage/methylation domain-containing protein
MANYRMHASALATILHRTGNRVRVSALMVPTMMRFPQRGRSRAFTLLELIVVIVILGVLALIAIPTFSAVIERSKTSAAQRSAEAIGRNALALAAFDQQSNVDADATPNNAADSDTYLQKAAVEAGLAKTDVTTDGTHKVTVNGYDVPLTFTGTKVTAGTPTATGNNGGNGGGGSGFNPADYPNLVSGLTITSISPDTAPDADTEPMVTITGTGFMTVPITIAGETHTFAEWESSSNAMLCFANYGSCFAPAVADDTTMYLGLNSSNELGLYGPQDVVLGRGPWDKADAWAVLPHGYTFPSN